MKNSSINNSFNTLLVIVSISTLILLLSIIARHELFNSGGDLAFFDQCVYLISQGKQPISSTLGFHILADHAAWILYFLTTKAKLSASASAIISNFSCAENFLLFLWSGFAPTSSKASSSFVSMKYDSSALPV